MHYPICHGDRGDSAGPARRGFRLQILNTRARLIEPQTTLLPEGIEDDLTAGGVLAGLGLDPNPGRRYA
ncbi:hypothetical protein [Lamprocystis purpurea]|uniref:hypothetical protein n=1 Tax=Lamprocystis purpurea TaxID=61598 RepID=UPI00058DEE7E|nr:hypothetical protein [Lamprocystis purpurea]